MLSEKLFGFLDLGSEFLLAIICILLFKLFTFCLNKELTAEGLFVTLTGYCDWVLAVAHK